MKPRTRQALIDRGFILPPVSKLETGTHTGLTRNHGRLQTRMAKHADDCHEPACNACHDCGAKPGEHHADGCDVERCMGCGGQRLLCGPGMHHGCQGTDEREIWTGTWPGVQDCERLNLWAVRNPNGPGWLPCDKLTPGATADLNRLYTDCVWDRKAKRWELKV